jgi:hypothetical protein
MFIYFNSFIFPLVRSPQSLPTKSVPSCVSPLCKLQLFFFVELLLRNCSALVICEGTTSLMNICVTGAVWFEPHWTKIFPVPSRAVTYRNYGTCPIGLYPISYFYFSSSPRSSFIYFLPFIFLLLFIFFNFPFFFINYFFFHVLFSFLLLAVQRFLLLPLHMFLIVHDPSHVLHSFPYPPFLCLPLCVSLYVGSSLVAELLDVNQLH